MRILDIGVAAAYGVLCLSVISFMGPYESQHQSAQAAYDSTASSAIFGYVRTIGLPFLSYAPPDQVCASLKAASTGVTVLGGDVGGHPCLGAPSSYLGSSTLVVTVSNRQVEIDAWVVEGQ